MNSLPPSEAQSPFNVKWGSAEKWYDRLKNFDLPLNDDDDDDEDGRDGDDQDQTRANVLKNSV